MNLPPSIRIGPFDYTVSSVSKTDEPIYDGSSGYIVHDSLLIKVDGSLTFQQQLETLLHEIQHGILYVADLQGTCEEEPLVSRTTPLWLCLFRDNPKLLELINEYAKPGT